MGDDMVTVVVASVTSCSAIIVIVTIICVCAFCHNKKELKTKTSSHEVLSRPRSPFILPEKLNTLDGYFERYEIDETRLFVTKISTLDIKLGKAKQQVEEKNLNVKSNGLSEEHRVVKEKELATKNEVRVTSDDKINSCKADDKEERNFLKREKVNANEGSEVCTHNTNQRENKENGETYSDKEVNADYDRLNEKEELENHESAITVSKESHEDGQNDIISDDFDEIISMHDEIHNVRFENESASRASTEHDAAFDTNDDNDIGEGKDAVDGRGSRLQFLEDILNENVTEETQVHEQPKRRRKQRRKELYTKQFEIGLFRYYLIRVQKRARKLTRKNLKVSPSNSTNHSARPKSPLRQRGMSYPRPESRMGDANVDCQLKSVNKKSQLDVPKSGKYVSDTNIPRVNMSVNSARSRRSSRVSYYSQTTSRSVSMKDINIGQYI
ncbi:hypothetical protein ACF0H5_020526 [Mactra antiquata]